MADEEKRRASIKITGPGQGLWPTRPGIEWSAWIAQGEDGFYRYSIPVAWGPIIVSKEPPKPRKK